MMKKIAVCMGTIFLLTPHPVFAQQMSNRCVTPQFWCQLSNFGPVGSPCYCNTPYGPVPGILR